MENVIYRGKVNSASVKHAPGTIIEYRVTQEVNCCIIWLTSVSTDTDEGENFPDTTFHQHRMERDAAIEEAVRLTTSARQHYKKSK